MERDNKYYNLIENLVKSHKKFPGYEPILDDIIDDVYAHSEVIISSINNEKVINAYLEKVISTSIITVPKKLRFIPEIQYRRPSVEKLIKQEVKTEYVDNMINASFEPQVEEEQEENLLEEIAVQEELSSPVEETNPVIEEETVEEVVESELTELPALEEAENEDILEEEPLVIENTIQEESEKPELALEFETNTEPEIEIPETLEVKEEEEEFIGTDFTDLSAFEPISTLEEEQTLPPAEELDEQPEPELEIEIPEVEEQEEIFELTEEEPESTILEEEVEEITAQEEEDEENEYSLEEFTLEAEPISEEPSISLDLEEEVEVLEETPEEEPVIEDSSSFSPTDYSAFGTRLSTEDEEEDLTLDAEEIASEIAKLDSKRPELNIIKVYNLKYKENASIPQIVDSLEMSESSVLEALSEIIALV